MSMLANASVSRALLGVEGLEELVGVGVADPADGSHEQQSEAGLDVAAGLDREVAECDRGFSVRERVAHQLGAVEVESGHLLDAVVDALNASKIAISGGPLSR